MTSINRIIGQSNPGFEMLTTFKITNFIKNLSKEQIFTETQDKAIEALFCFFTNQMDKLEQDHFDAVNACFSKLESKNNLLTFNLTTVMHVNASIDYSKIRGTQKYLPALIRLCKSQNFALELAQQASNVGKLSLPSPFSKNRAECQESYESQGGMNSLRFTDGNQSFFLIQHVSSNDALYFPLQNVLLIISHITAPRINRLRATLTEQFPAVVNYAANTNKPFGGIVCSHLRPAHYFYENWPPLYQLYSNPEIYPNIPHFITRKPYDYSDLRQVFPDRSTSALNTDEINEFAFNEEQWFLHLGTNRTLRNSNYDYYFANRFLVDKVLQSPSTTAQNLAAPLAERFPIVWIGVESQKRCWLEQVEGYSYIINQLAESYPDLAVVIDGWTLPVSPLDEAIPEVEEDLLLAQAIQKKLKPNIGVISTIGENSHTKIVIGSKINFFISNFASGSLHVSLLLGKPGFAHLNTKLTKITLESGIQIHPNKNVYLLPNQYIQDTIPKGERLKNWLNKNFGLFKSPAKPHTDPFGVISYSIDKKKFYQFIESKLEKVLNNPQPPKQRIFTEIPGTIEPKIRTQLKQATHGNLLMMFPTMGIKNIGEIANILPEYRQRHLIYGNLIFGCHKQIDLEAAHYLIWLARPIKRTYLHAELLHKHAIEEGNFNTLEQLFDEKPKTLDNLYTRRISGMDPPFGECTEAMLTKAIENLKNHFIFIGIDEQHSDSLDRLCGKLDLDRSLFSTAESEFDESSIPQPILKKLRLLNQFDSQLYSTASNIVLHQKNKNNAPD
ncbi:hypothetical protein JCM14076_25120 [Methylosoma difficile]